MGDLQIPEGMYLRAGVITSTDVPRLEQCPASGVFGIQKDRQEAPHGGMWWGIILHRFLEYATEKGHDAAHEYIKSKKWVALKRTCLRIDLDAIPHGSAEVPYAHNVFAGTARRLFGHFAVNQCDPHSEQYGKADLSIDAQAGWPRPMVADYKSGYDGEKPLESTQMLGLGSSRILEEDLDAVDLALVKVHSTGELDWHVQTMDREDAAAWTSRARRVHLGVLENRTRAGNGVSPDFCIGDQCDYCNLRPVCPAHL